MGIPRLTQDLSHYTELAVLSSRSEGNEDEVPISKIVIDGPSLVYHVYDGLLRRMTPAEIASATMPTYSEVIAGVGSLIKALCDKGVMLEAMFFDGDLPVSKRGVRLERMEKTRKQLEDFRQLNPVLLAFETRGTSSTDDTWDLRHRPISSVRHTLPPLPFLVPAVIEALKASGDIRHVQVVPEEADIACARSGRASGAAVLTNDSDLALYDLGPDGCVLILRSLTSQDVKNSRRSELSNGIEHDQVQDDSRLVASCLRPVKIAQRIGLSSLLKLGFDRFQDPSVGTNMITKRARESSPDGKRKTEFEEFRKEFEITNLPTVPKSSCLLDPRTSEFIVQSLTSPEAPQVHLPILYEDPSRDSSWEYGLAYRQLAYSIVYSSKQHKVPENVIEYVRRGSRIAETTVSMLRDDEAKTAVRTLSQSLSTAFKTASSNEIHPPPPPDLDSIPEWYAAGLVTVLQHKLDNLKAPFSHASLDRLFGINTNKPANKKFTPTWEDLHLLANTHAALYSWRMLKQIVDWTYERAEAGGDLRQKPMVDGLEELRFILTQTPSCRDLFLSLQGLRSTGTTEARKNAAKLVKKALSQHIEQQREDSALGSREGNRRKRVKMSSKVKTKKSSAGWSRGNAFGALGSDDEADG